MPGNGQLISIAEARKLLDDDGKGLSDDQIEELISQLEIIARLAIRQYQTDNINSTPKSD